MQYKHPTIIQLFNHLGGNLSKHSAHPVHRKENNCVLMCAQRWYNVEEQWWIKESQAYRNHKLQVLNTRPSQSLSIFSSNKRLAKIAKKLRSFGCFFRFSPKIFPSFIKMYFFMYECWHDYWGFLGRNLSETSAKVFTHNSLY